MLRRIVCLLIALSLLLDRPLLAWSAAQEEQPVRGVIIVIGGVGGMDVLAASANLAWPRAGVKHEIREFVWTHGRGKPFTDLQDRDHLRAKAAELADYIRRLKAENPNRPIFIVAKSGGTGLALLAAELLPANTLERMILLSAAVSPDFDLRRALLATHGEIVSFHSANDQVILNLGTRQFGTIDGVHGPSAGLHGFRLPDMHTLSDDDRDLYRRLVQIPWSPSRLLELDNGSHTSTSLPIFLATHVAPWLR